MKSAEPEVWHSGKLDSLKATQLLAKEFAKRLRRPCIVLLYGEVGAGKTEFIRAVVGALGGDGVRSPTYTYHQVVSLQNGSIDHLDLYRVQNAEDLESIGWRDILGQRHAMVFVEWPHLVEKDSLPNGWQQWRVNIKLEANSGAVSRSITIEVLNDPFRPRGDRAHK